MLPKRNSQAEMPEECGAMRGSSRATRTRISPARTELTPDVLSPPLSPLKPLAWIRDSQETA